MLKQDSPTNLSNDNFIEEVDLNYEFLTDDERNCIYIKFNGFSDDIQMEQFAEFMKTSIPLLFTHTTKH
jgi:hypothetical protein